MASIGAGQDILETELPTDGMFHEPEIPVDTRYLNINDAVGRRAWTKTPTIYGGTGTNVFHVYDGPNVIADLDAGHTNRILRSYVWGPGADALLAMTVYTGTVARTYYAIRDHQNTVWAFTDTNGVVVERYDYDAWGFLNSVKDGSGNLIVSPAFGIPVSALGNRYMFQGREYSTLSGLYCFRARWFSPITGRWISNDPIGINGGLNQYVAFANNPVCFVDPSGLSTVYITTANGSTKLVDPSLEAFADAIRHQANGSITELHMTGHGTRSFLDIDNGGGGLSWPEFDETKSIQITDNHGNFADLVRDKLAKDASVYLDGCNTAREFPFQKTENIARQLSRELPGVKVEGNAGFAIGNELKFWYLGSDTRLRLGRSTVTVGIPRSYLNGN